MHNIKKHQCNEHRQRVQAVLVGLVVWDGTCKAFRILGNAEQYSKLSVLSAAIYSDRIYVGQDDKPTVMSVKTAYNVYNNRRAWAFFAAGLSLAKVL